MTPFSLKGFTLVETLVAITILSIAIVGPFHAVQSALIDAYTARDYLIASALAQEGLEYVHSVRDSNYIYNAQNPGAPGSWLFGIDGSTRAGATSANCSSPSNVCTIEPTQIQVTTGIVRCSGSCSPLSTTTANLFTQTSGGTQTRFTRSITYTTVNAREVQVSSSVTWRTAQTNFSVVDTENFQNWL